MKLIETSEYDDLAKCLLENITHYETELIKLSRSATENSTKEAKQDLEYSKLFLANYSANEIPKMRKPKGNVFIVLSFNEPLILSIIPVFCSLVMGNNVSIKPSSRNRDLFKLIWSTNHELKERLTIVDCDNTTVEDYIKISDAVYFFGSGENSKKVYKICAQYNVQFIPEVESSDVKVFKSTISNLDMINDITTTIKESFNRKGRICQRIHGLYVNQEVYKEYLNLLEEFLKSDGYINNSIEPNNSVAYKDIIDSKPKSVFTKSEKVVVIEPSEKSDFIYNAYFSETLWVLPYKDLDCLIDSLNSRKYFMGLNLKSDDEIFTSQVIKNTKFSRYTLIEKHCDISSDFGWGGNWPTGSGGYATWYDSFSNAFAIIR